MEYSKKIAVARETATILAENKATVANLDNIFQEVKDRLKVCVRSSVHGYSFGIRYHIEMPDEIEGKLAMLLEKSEATVNDLEDILKYAKKQLLVYVKLPDRQNSHSCAKLLLTETESEETGRVVGIAREVAKLLADEKVTVYELPSIARHVKDRLLVSYFHSFRGGLKQEYYETDEKVAMFLDEKMATVNETEAVFAYVRGLLAVRMKGGE